MQFVLNWNEMVKWTEKKKVAIVWLSHFQCTHIFLLSVCVPLFYFFFFFDLFTQPHNYKYPCGKRTMTMTVTLTMATEYSYYLLLALLLTLSLWLSVVDVFVFFFLFFLLFCKEQRGWYSPEKVVKQLRLLDSLAH